MSVRHLVISENERSRLVQNTSPAVELTQISHEIVHSVVTTWGKLEDLIAQNG